MRNNLEAESIKKMLLLIINKDEFGGNVEFLFRWYILSCNVGIGALVLRFGAGAVAGLSDANKFCKTDFAQSIKDNVITYYQLMKRRW
nr:MAG: hypothetical protein CM15mV30_1810 [uncultured marine virus]